MTFCLTANGRTHGEAVLNFADAAHAHPEAPAIPLITAAEELLVSLNDTRTVITAYGRHDDKGEGMVSITITSCHDLTPLTPIEGDDV